MSLKLVFMLLAAAGLFGLDAGYYLRFLISLGKRGSMELRIKQMELKAREDAKSVVEEAEKKAHAILDEV